MFRSVSRFASRQSSLFTAQQLQQQATVATPLASPELASRCFSTPPPTNDDKYFHRTSFVHPLSQIVLEYLQARKSGWLIQQRLDRSLKIHSDGSFEMKYPSRNKVPSKPARIFTFYDRKDAKHYLAVQKGYLNERYMLQDNKASPWHTNKKSVFDRIHLSVDELIHAVDRLDGVEREKKMRGTSSGNVRK